MKDSKFMDIDGIDCYEQDGIVYYKLIDVARELGFTKTETKGGRTYTSIRWERLFGYLKELGFSTQVDKDGYIPENIFYRLAMKAQNKTAEKLQVKIADEIIPSIRKHGSYITKDTLEAALYDPDTLLEIARQLKADKDLCSTNK